MRWNMEDPSSTSETTIFSQPTYGMSFLTPLQALHIEQISLLTTVASHRNHLKSLTTRLQYLFTDNCRFQILYSWNIVYSHTYATVSLLMTLASSSSQLSLFPDHPLLFQSFLYQCMASHIPFILLSLGLCLYLLIGNTHSSTSLRCMPFFVHICTSHVLCSFYVKENSVNTVVL